METILGILPICLLLAMASWPVGGDLVIGEGGVALGDTSAFQVEVVAIHIFWANFSEKPLKYINHFHVKI